MSNQMTKRIEHPLISLTTYLRARPLRVIGGLAAFIVALTVLASVSVRANDPEATSTMTLEPGRNFVGWVSEPIAVSDVFTQLPAADLIYTWDPNLRRYRTAYPDGGGSLDALEPGMAATINIDGRRSVKWERPLTPAKGMVTLYRGVNWVTWVGRDEWPLDQVARGIGQSLVSIRVGDSTWPAPLDASLDDLPVLRRGDPLQVTVSRDLSWLQPTGILPPNVVWAGDVPQSLKDKITADIRRTVDFFAATFAVETDFSETTILLYHSIDAAVEHDESGAEPRIGNPPGWLRNQLTHGGQASAWRWGFYMPTCAWQSPAPQPCRSKSVETLTHEWFHLLQTQLAASDVWRVSPTWMTEGSAMWVEWLLPAESRTVPYERDRKWRVDQVARTSVRLQGVEDWNGSWSYLMGPVAAERLADLSGNEALTEFYRSLHPQIIGKEQRWERAPSWNEAFETAFGLTPSAFYGDFAAWRETLPAPARRYDYNQGDVTLSGTLRDHSGSPANAFRLNAAPYIDGFVSVGSQQRRAIVDTNGAFSIDLAPETTQRIWLTRDGCTLWLTDSGLTEEQPQAGQYRDLDTRDLPRLNVTLPEDACENELRARVLKLRGDDRRVSVGLDSDSGHISGTQHRGEDTYSLSVPHPGHYRVLVRVGGCNLWYAAGGLVATREKPDPIELGDDLVSLKVRVPYDLCVRQISGRLIDTDGAPLSGVWLAAYEGWKYGGTFSDANGEFRITVPDSGVYQLSFGTQFDDCRIRYSSSGATTVLHQATPISVEDQDVPGIEFVVPADPAGLCN